VLVVHLGAHGTGIIALAWLVTALTGILELGLAPALSAELSRRTAVAGAARPGLSLLRAFELPCWATAAVVALGLAYAGPLVAESWIPEGAGDVELARCMRLMGIGAGLSLVINLYVSSLLGLGRQAAANAVRVIASVGQHVVGVTAVVVTGGGAEVWLIAAAIGSLAAASIGRILIVRHHVVDAGIDWSSLMAAGVFIRGMGLIGLLSVALGCLDRVLISPRLPLRDFAAYTLAVMAGSGFRLISAALFGVIFPRLTALAANGDESAQSRLYLRSSRWLASIFAPAVAVVVIAGESVLIWWCRDADLGHRAAIVVGLLAAGSAINGLLSIPCALQLAHRRTSLTVGSAIAALAGMTVIIVYLAPEWGSAGVAVAWPVVHIAVVACVVPLTHRRILRGLSESWFVAVGVPIIATALTATACASLPLLRTSIAGGVATGAICMLAAFLAALWDERRTSSG